MTTALPNRVHIFAHPDTKDRLTAFFRDILGCEVIAVPGTPIVAFRFSNNGSLSIEFTEAALNQQQALHSAWLEVRSDDTAALQQKVLDAGLLQVKYPLTDRFYFQAPGGQVFGIAEL